MEYFDFELLYIYYKKLLWSIFPKRTENIKGDDITYVCIPFFMIRSDKKGWFSQDNKSQLLYHRPSDTLMIFLVGKVKYPRFMIFHEHFEGQLLKQNKNKEELLEIAIEYFDYDKTKGLSEKIHNFLEEWIESQGAHVIALLEELELAREELPTKEYIIYKHNRLSTIF